MEKESKGEGDIVKGKKMRGWGIKARYMEMRKSDVKKQEKTGLEEERNKSIKK